jgi:anti-sigma factor RsiW
MSLKHLNDNEIQEYLDGRFAPNGRHITDHLDACDDCRAQVDRYQSLFGALQTDAGVKLSASFSQNVLAKLAPEPQSAWRFGFSQLMLAVASLIIATGITLYFTSVQPILAAWGFVTKIVNSVNLEWLGEINTFVSGLNLNLSLLAVAVLVVVIMSLVDYVLLRPRDKVASFFRMLMI